MHINNVIDIIEEEIKVASKNRDTWREALASGEIEGDTANHTASCYWGQCQALQGLLNRLS